MSQDKENLLRRKGIYLLPNLFTTAGLFAGFYAIVASINGRFEIAAIAIFVAMVMDGVDGRVARMTNTQSDFGAEYDSMADMVSFGLAPALVMHQWALSSITPDKLGWMAAFIYTCGAALRLARFNMHVATADKRYFQGLASPAAAALIAGLIWVGDDFGMKGDNLSWLALFVTLAAGVLMVSNIRYHSFKQVDLHGKVPFVVMVVIMLVFALIYLHPPLVLFSGFLIYAASGPVLSLYHWQRRRAARAAGGPSRAVETEEKRDKTGTDSE